MSYDEDEGFGVDSFDDGTDDLDPIGDIPDELAEDYSDDPEDSYH